MNEYEERSVIALRALIRDLLAAQGGDPKNSTIAPVVDDLRATISGIEARAEQRLAQAARASQ